jgi:hypothetical protein
MTPASAIEVVAAKIAQLFVLLLGMTGLALTVARLDPVALAHGDLADAAGRLRGYRGIVAFDPPANGDRARLTFRPGQEEVPHPETGEASEKLVAEILISEKLPPALAPPLVESPPVLLLRLSFRARVAPDPPRTK